VGELLAVGGIDFGAVLAEDGGGRSSATAAPWPNLPFAGEECRAVATLAREALGGDEHVQRLEGARATKPAIYAALPGKRWVHFATHAFFEPRSSGRVPRRGREEWSLGLERSELERLMALMPGLSTGLVCAGANAPRAADGEGALLTAEEVTWLDLSACELVVLSACDTALGERRGGEGMQSLRRSFGLAGARTVIASLWKVDDRRTGALMEGFYRGLWEQGLPKGDALRAAQLELLAAARREHAGFGDPRAWGAFVLTGDWR
jgi:CHAT domain-containing protein